jgi:hypothetical protein
VILNNVHLEPLYGYNRTQRGSGTPFILVVTLAGEPGVGEMEVNERRGMSLAEAAGEARNTG